MLIMRRVPLSPIVVLLFILSAVTVSSDALAQGAIQTDTRLQPFTLSSSTFHDGGPLPATSEYGGGFGCHGKNIAPTLKWKNVPLQTSSFALVMNDVDAAVAGGFHHWIIYNIPPSAQALQGNAPYTQGTNSLNTHSYFGPCPPPTGQMHHYIFTLYALTIDHVQKEGLTYDGLIQAINGKVVGAATIIGTFRLVPPGTSSN